MGYSAAGVERIAIGKGFESISRVLGILLESIKTLIFVYALG